MINQILLSSITYTGEKYKIWVHFPLFFWEKTTNPNKIWCLFDHIKKKWLWTVAEGHTTFFSCSQMVIVINQSNWDIAKVARSTWLSKTIENYRYNTHIYKLQKIYCQELKNRIPLCSIRLGSLLDTKHLDWSVMKWIWHLTYFVWYNRDEGCR